MNMVPRKWPHQWLKAGACAAALVMAAHAGAAETVKIGFIDLLSGPFALTGQSSLNQLREVVAQVNAKACLLYTSPSPRDQRGSRMPSSA